MATRPDAATPPTQLQSARKFYDETAFVVDDRKLGRLTEIATERLLRVNSGEPLVVQFSVTFADGKILGLSSLAQVLALDNTVHNPIKILDADCFTMSQKGERPPELSPYRISFVFDGDRLAGREIRLYAWSLDPSWLIETMGALEEQAERCRPTEFIYTLKGRRLYGLLVAIGLLLVGIGMFIRLTQAVFLSSETKIALQRAASAARSDSEKIDVIFKYVQTNFALTPQDSIERYATDIHTYLIAVPILVAVAAALVAIARYYPPAVFAWGDFGEHYKRLIERRKFMWYTVVAALVIGILANLFVMGLTGFSAK